MCFCLPRLAGILKSSQRTCRPVALCVCQAGGSPMYGCGAGVLTLNADYLDQCTHTPPPIWKHWQKSLKSFQIGDWHCAHHVILSCITMETEAREHHLGTSRGMTSAIVITVPPLASLLPHLSQSSYCKIWKDPTLTINSSEPEKNLVSWSSSCSFAQQNANTLKQDFKQISGLLSGF